MVSGEDCAQTKEEWNVIDTFVKDENKDENIMVLPADKGRVTVVMKEKYVEKCNLLLKDEKTYQKMKGDPTRKYKDRFVEVLQDLKDREVIDKFPYKKLYPTVDQPPRFYDLPKVHKCQHAIGPIGSSIGTILYKCAHYLAKILSTGREDRAPCEELQGFCERGQGG